MLGESVIQIKSGIAINIDAGAKNITHMKSYIWNPSICSCGNGKNLASINDNLMITYGENAIYKITTNTINIIL